MLTAALLGFALGLRHAFDPDHVIAVSAIAARHRSPWQAAWIGATWGLGHGATLLSVGVAVVALRVAIPEAFALSAEFAVGLLLVALGAANLLSHARGPIERGHGAAPMRALLWRSGGLGLAHGLAGSGAVSLLALAAMPSAEAALLYLGVFGVGSVAGMIAFSLAMAAPAAAIDLTPARHRFVMAATGGASLVFGSYLLYEVGIVQGLLLAA